MPVELGVDTLTYHLRLCETELTHIEVAQEIADLGFSWMQVNAKTGGLGDWPASRVRELGSACEAIGLRVLYSGMDIGKAGSDIDGIADRVKRWAQHGRLLGSDVVRVYFAWWRQDAAATPHGMQAERDYARRVLAAIATAAESESVVVAVENHSNFTADDVNQLVSEHNPRYVRVHFDVANAVSIPEAPDHAAETLGSLTVSGHIKNYSVESVLAPDRRHRLGFNVFWRYPHEGVLDIGGLLRTVELAAGDRVVPMTIEGLDHARGEHNQRAKLKNTLRMLEAEGFTP